MGHQIVIEISVSSYTVFVCSFLQLSVKMTRGARYSREPEIGQNSLSSMRVKMAALHKIPDTLPSEKYFLKAVRLIGHHLLTWRRECQTG